MPGSLVIRNQATKYVEGCRPLVATLQVSLKDLGSSASVDLRESQIDQNEWVN
jgi:hypothetical protein